MQHIYDAKEGDVFWAASDVGWVVGHSYIVYGPLFNRNTTILFEGNRFVPQMQVHFGASSTNIK
jgi:acyl-coenzyme A synthetase/AMP-(fatty) acid ligase